MILRHRVVGKIRAAAPYNNLFPMDLDANEMNEQRRMQINAANTATQEKNKYCTGMILSFSSVAFVLLVLTHLHDFIKFNIITRSKYIAVHRICMLRHL